MESASPCHPLAGPRDGTDVVTALAAPRCFLYMVGRSRTFIKPQSACRGRTARGCAVRVAGLEVYRPFCRARCAHATVGLWKAAHEELYAAVQHPVGNAETLDAQQVWAVHYTWEAKQQAYEDAPRAPRICRQQSVTFPPKAGAKFLQPLLHGSDEWARTYSTLRNASEGMNGDIKDGAHAALDDPRRRRVRGVAAQSVFVALALVATNLRRIDAFARKARPDAKGVLRKPRPPRRTRPLGTWRPKVPARSGAPPPSSKSATRPPPTTTSRPALVPTRRHADHVAPHEARRRARGPTNGPDAPGQHNRGFRNELCRHFQQVPSEPLGGRGGT